MELFSEAPINIVAITATLFAGIIAYYLWRFQYWKRRNVPYFEARFPLGNSKPSDKDVPPGHDIIFLAQEAYKKGWKYFGVFIMTHPSLVLLDADLIKCILTKDFNNFTDKSDDINEEDDPLTGNLVFIGGTKWRNLRTKMSPTFTSGKMRSMFNIITSCGKVLEDIIKKHDKKEPLDIRHMLSCFTTDVIGACAFGLECNSFKDPQSPFLMYGKRIFNGENRPFSLSKTIKAFIKALFPQVARSLHFKLIDPAIDNFYFDIVTKAVNFREKNNYPKKDFLQLLIDLKNKSPDERDEKGNEMSITMNELVAQCFVFFLAGYETSSSTMTWALYELAIHPEIQEKLREELLKVLKKYDNEICYESVQEMVYLQQVIDETLRKYPPLITIPRMCVRDYKLPDSDLKIEKGTRILIPIKAIHYMDCHYENPDKFDPERFTTEEKQKRHPYAHIPFGEGPRICIGMRFGLMQSKIGLISILRNYRVKLHPKTKTPIKISSTSATPAIDGDLWLDLEAL